jgi:hypothetical protein
MPILMLQTPVGIRRQCHNPLPSQNLTCDDNRLASGGSTPPTRLMDGQFRDCRVQAARFAIVFRGLRHPTGQ